MGALRVHPLDAGTGLQQRKAYRARSLLFRVALRLSRAS